MTKYLPKNQTSSPIKWMEPNVQQNTIKWNWKYVFLNSTFELNTYKLISKYLERQAGKNTQKKILLLAVFS